MSCVSMNNSFGCKTHANYNFPSRAQILILFLFQISALWSFGIYTSPFILTSLYRRDMFTPNGAVTISKFFMGVFVLYVVSMNIRALGRATNPTYREFMETLITALKDFKVENKKKIQLYDFEFSSWPVEFSMKGR